METKKLAIVLAIAIAIIAGAAVYLSWDGSDDSSKDIEPIPDDDNISELMIYGNANNDLYVDQKDVNYIQDVIDGKAAKTKFSDANNDGVVDSNDIDQVKDMIAGKDGTKVWFIDGYDRTMPVTWPVDRVVVLENSPQLVALSAGIEDKVVGYSKQDTFLYQNFSHAEYLGPINVAKYELIFSTNPDMVVVSNGEGGNNPAPHHTTSGLVLDPTLKSIYEKRGVDIVPVEPTDADRVDDFAITLGYLCGTHDKAMEYYKWSNDLFDTIDSNIAKIPKEKRHTALVVMGGAPNGGSVSGIGTDYAAALERAGGINLADWTDVKKVNAENGTWIFKYDPEFLFRVGTIGYGNIAENEDAGISQYETARKIFEPMNAVKNDKFFYVDMSIPMNLRIAYLAEIMYPEVFGDGFGDKWHSKLLDVYGLEFNVNGQFVVTPEDYRNA